MEVPLHPGSTAAEGARGGAVTGQGKANMEFAPDLSGSAGHQGHGRAKPMDFARKDHLLGPAQQKLFCICTQGADVGVEESHKAAASLSLIHISEPTRPY